MICKKGQKEKSMTELWRVYLYDLCPRVVFLIVFTLLFNPAGAQPWSKKAAQAVFTLKTFGPDGSLLGSSNGFFVGENGEALSSFTPFKGASRAVVIDAQGKEWPVECLMGANDMYDVAKFMVTVKKPTTLTLAASAANGTTAWMLPYTVKKAPECIQGTVSSSESFQGNYAYYTLAMQVPEQHAGSPVLNDNGEVLGLLQPAANGAAATTSYAVSATFANDLRISGLSLNDPALRSTNIAKALPDQLDEALLTIYMAATVMDQAQYEELLNRFIQKFPDAADGYIYRARIAVAKGDFAAANADMKQALSVGGKTDDTHYQFAQMIYQKEVYQHDQPFSEWNLDLALEESRKANSLNPQPVYLKQQAQILYVQKKYDESFKLFEQLTQTPLRDADIFYSAAQCKLQLGEREQMLALLDSAVNTFTKPYVKTAAPYLLARANALFDAGKYRPAVNDYNDYEALMASQLTAEFYYQREQAEMAGHLYKQALEDIVRATEMAPAEPIFFAEKANVELRVGKTDEAIATAQQSIRISPDNSDGYLILGLAQCLKGQKEEGLKNLNKAKELGNSQAQTLIDKYSN